MKTPESTPIHGKISYYGKSWTIEFKPASPTCTHETLSGYGDFPFEKYPGLPVIDLENNEKVWEFLRLEFEAIDANRNPWEYGIEIARNLQIDIKIYDAVKGMVKHESHQPYRG